MVLQAQLYNWLHSFAGVSPTGDAIIVFFAVYFPIIISVLALIYILTSARKRPEKISAIASALAAALIARILFTGALRSIVHEARPFTLANAHSLFLATGSSFPSAHATILFAIATVLYSFDKRAGLLFFIFSLIVSIARVVAGVHYPIDIAAGMLVGIATARLFLAYGSPLMQRYIRTS